MRKERSDGIANVMSVRNSEPASVRTSCQLKKALIMPFRGEMSERICNARTVTEGKENRTLPEKGVRTSYVALEVLQRPLF